MCSKLYISSTPLTATLFNARSFAYNFYAVKQYGWHGGLTDVMGSCISVLYSVFAFTLNTPKFSNRTLSVAVSPWEDIKIKCWDMFFYMCFYRYSLQICFTINAHWHHIQKISHIYSILYRLYIFLYLSNNERDICRRSAEWESYWINRPAGANLDQMMPLECCGALNEVS